MISIKTFNLWGEGGLEGGGHHLNQLGFSGTNRFLSDEIIHYISGHLSELAPAKNADNVEKKVSWKTRRFSSIINYYYRTR